MLNFKKDDWQQQFPKKYNSDSLEGTWQSAELMKGILPDKGKDGKMQKLSPVSSERRS